MRALPVFVAAVALAGCALRPRYGEFIGKETTAPVKLQVLEKKSGLPIPGALVEVGELSRGKLNVKTDAEGYFTLPVDKKLMDDNALIVVMPPPGFGRAQVIAAPMPVAEPVPPPPAPASAVEAALDAGS